jgi:hypothetical protein
VTGKKRILKLWVVICGMLGEKESNDGSLSRKQVSQSVEAREESN